MTRNISKSFEGREMIMFGPKSVLSAVALLGIVGLGCSCNKLEKPNDDAITIAIQAKMYSEPLLKASSLNVATKGGIVTLTGRVPDDAARLAAERISSQTDGVKQVIDSTTMAAPAPVAATMSQNAPEHPRSAVPPPPAPSRRDRPKRNRDDARDRNAEPYDGSSTSMSSNSGLDSSANSSAASSTAAQVNPAPAPAAPVIAAPPPQPASPPPPQPVTVTIPSNTVVTIRTIDTIDSTANKTGQTFNASIDEPIIANSRVIVPKGSNATLKLVNANSAGKYKGTSELTVSLDSFTYQGKTYMVSTTDVQEKGSSRGKRSAAVIGGGAVLGAIIGGIAGGGKGAAIGAAAGGGGGAAVQGLTKGQQIKIPAETRLDFTLHDSVSITYLPTRKLPSTPSNGPDSGAANNSSSSNGSNNNSSQPSSPSSDQPPHP
jgi:hypothetical protein